MNDFNDGALLEHWEKTGDAQAFMELVARYQGMVYGVCLRILRDPSRAEDLVQECFLKLTHTRPKQLSTLGPWLHRIATNASIDSLRKDSRRTQRESEFIEQQSTSTESTWDDVNEILDEELDALPDPYREAIVAHFLKGFTHAEVAHELNTHRTTILLFSLPLVWMSIHSAQFDGLPEAFNQFMPSAFGSGSVTANGFNGSVTFLVKLPIWLFVAIGAIGILINISKTLRITSTPKLIPLLFLSFSAFYVAVALCVSVWSSDASMEIGNTVAIIGLVAGFFSTLKSPYQTS